MTAGAYSNEMDAKYWLVIALVQFQKLRLGDHSYFAYIVVDNADEYHAEISNNGTELIKALKSEPWGMREFGVRTNDGHRIMFGQEIEN